MQRQDEEAWPRSKQDDLFLQGYDDSTYAVVAVDRDGRFIYVNRAATSMVGWSEGEMLGRRMIMIMPARFHDQFEHAFSRYLSTREYSLLGETVAVKVKTNTGFEKQTAMRLEGYVLPDGEHLIVAVMSPLDSGARPEGIVDLSAR